MCHGSYGSVHIVTRMEAAQRLGWNTALSELGDMQRVEEHLVVLLCAVISAQSKCSKQGS
jgi:hypothetical protein